MSTTEPYQAKKSCFMLNMEDSAAHNSKLLTRLLNAKQSKPCEPCGIRSAQYKNCAAKCFDNQSVLHDFWLPLASFFFVQFLTTHYP